MFNIDLFQTIFVSVLFFIFLSIYCYHSFYNTCLSFFNFNYNHDDYEPIETTQELDDDDFQIILRGYVP